AQSEVDREQRREEHQLGGQPDDRSDADQVGPIGHPVRGCGLGCSCCRHGGHYCLSPRSPYRRGTPLGRVSLTIHRMAARKPDAIRPNGEEVTVTSMVERPSALGRRTCPPGSCRVIRSLGLVSVGAASYAGSHAHPPSPAGGAALRAIYRVPYRGTRSPRSGGVFMSAAALADKSGPGAFGSTAAGAPSSAPAKSL